MMKFDKITDSLWVSECKCFEIRFNMRFKEIFAFDRNHGLIAKEPCENHTQAYEFINRQSKALFIPANIQNLNDDELLALLEA